MSFSARSRERLAALPLAELENCRRIQIQQYAEGDLVDRCTGCCTDGTGQSAHPEVPHGLLPAVRWRGIWNLGSFDGEKDPKMSDVK